MEQWTSVWRHLSLPGEVRGLDHREITQEQTSLNLLGAMEGGRSRDRGTRRERERERGREGGGGGEEKIE